MRWWPRRRALVIAAFVAAIWLPHVFAADSTNPHLPLGWPGVYSGDEPHHFIILASVLRDRDLDVGDNYERARAGRADAGRRFAGARLDHHTTWYAGGERIMWRDVYGIDGVEWEQADGRLAPAPRDGQAHHDEPAAEYSQHPPGVAFLVAPLLWPVAGSWLLEPLALLLSGLCVLVTAVALRRLARLYVTTPATLDFVTAMAILGTPAWHYGRTLFGESFMMALVTGGLALALSGRRYVLAGGCFALAVLIKPIVLLVPFPLWCWLLARRDVGALVRFSAPMAAGVAAYMLLNAWMFGGPFRIAQPGAEWQLAFTEHLLGLDHGLLPYAPVVVVGLVGFLRLYRERPALTSVIAGGAGLYAAFVMVQLTTGGYCYGPRYLVPVLPLLALGLLRLNLADPRRWIRITVFLLCVVSVAINAVGAIHSWGYWSTHPAGALLFGS